MVKVKALKCDKCAAPMTDWKECDHCGTNYAEEVETPSFQEPTPAAAPTHSVVFTSSTIGYKHYPSTIMYPHSRGGYYYGG